MKFTTSQQNEDLAKVAKRLFRPRSKAAQQEAEEKLAAANPQIAGSKEIPPGTVIVIPASPEDKPAGEQSPPELGRIVSLLQQARARVSELHEGLEASAIEQESQAKTTQELIKSSGIQKLAKASPEIGKRIPEIANAAKARIERAQTLRKMQDTGVRQLEKNLDAMIARLGGSPDADEPAAPKRKEKR